MGPGPWTCVCGKLVGPVNCHFLSVPAKESLGQTRVVMTQLGPSLDHQGPSLDNQGKIVNRRYQKIDNDC